GRADRTSRAARTDDDRLSGESADAGDISVDRLVRPGSGRAPTVHDPLALRRLTGDDPGGGPPRSLCPVRTVRLGAGAGYSGDRIEPAIGLATDGQLDYLVFECLAERTIALAQQVRARDGRAGFDPLLAERMRAVLPACRARGVRILTNMGAANPVAAA